ncbi:MAG: hypothetical protein AAFN63_06995 [Pseudomonadota bacterium]
MAATKIATCCYCGTKAALVMRGKERHELACSNCGAPLHAMKMLPKQPGQAPSAQATKGKRTEKSPDYRRERPKKRKKSKGFGRRVMSEIWDVVEDVVEEIFD